MIDMQERERRMDFIPERSEIQLEDIQTRDKDVVELINQLGIRKLVPGLQKKQKPAKE